MRIKLFEASGKSCLSDEDSSRHLESLLSLFNCRAVVFTCHVVIGIDGTWLYIDEVKKSE